MKLFAALAVAIALTSALSVAAAERLFSLRAVAAQSGFSFTWLAGEQAASIAKPGVVILVRPGNPLVEINDTSEMAATAPRSAGDDILVPGSIVRRIRSFARAESANAILNAGSLALAQRPFSGALAVRVEAARGQEAILVTGTGPQNAPVTLTLTTSISPDIPDVVLSRTDLAIDRTGTFAATISIAPDFLRGSTVLVRATSIDGVAPAQAQLLVGPPGSHITPPAHVSLTTPVFSV